MHRAANLPMQLACEISLGDSSDYFADGSKASVLHG